MGTPHHFRDKAGLIGAILEKHQKPLDDRRREMLDRQERSGNTTDLRELVRILVEPLLQELDDASGRAYVQIQAQLEPREPTPLPATHIMLHRIRLALGGGTPAPRRAMRDHLVSLLLFSAMASRARSEERGAAKAEDRLLFASELMGSIIAILTREYEGDAAQESVAPVASEETRSANG
jgi:AcrR family transcriptional regulator